MGIIAHMDKDAIIAYQFQQIQQLTARLTELERLLYGDKRESTPKSDASQSNEDQNTDSQQEEDTKDKPKRKSRRSSQNRRSVGDKWEHLDRVEEIITPSVDISQMHKVGEERTEILSYQPCKVYIRVLIRPKYVDKDEGFHIADLPSLPITKGNADARLLSHIISSKYIDHLPIHRIVKRFERHGASISDTTTCDWIKRSADLLHPIYQAIKSEVLSSDYIQADETPIKVLHQNKDKKGKSHRGYYWVYYHPLTHSALFEYQQGRGKEYPAETLADFQGYLQTDGYKGYLQFKEKEGVRLFGCAAHQRRKFFQALNNDAIRASHALEVYQQLYQIEDKLTQQNASFEERKNIRKQEAIPIIEAFHKWLEQQQKEVLPKSSIGKAVDYALNQIKEWKVYVEDGRLQIDNNWIENSIRPIAIGRKNYLFAGSHQAAQRAAVIYTIIASCIKNKLNPEEYITQMLETLPEHPINRVDELIPSQWAKLA